MALYGALFFELGVNLPFLPVWLRSRSLDDAEIGIVLAVPLLVRIIANPLMTALADRTGRLRPVVIACATAVAISTTLLAFTDGFASILAVVALIAVGQGPLIALTDALALRHLGRHPRAELVYGRIRLCGSIAFALASLSAGAILSVLAPWAIVALLSGAAAAAALAAARVPEPATPVPVSMPHPSDSTARPRTVLLAIIIGAALIQASHAAYYGFATLHWQSRGYSGAAMGALWACGIAGEVLVFALAGRAAAGLRGACLLLAAGGGAAVLRWAAMSADPAWSALVLLQLSHGLTFGATHLGSVFALTHLSGVRHRAQAQGWLAALWALSMAGLTSLAGAWSEAWGQGIYGLMGLTAGVGLVLLLVGFAVHRQAARRRLPGDAPSSLG